MGYYDFQHGGKGYQGEFLIDTGITGGYAHKIGKNLSLEYSLGIGYINTHYNHYKDIFADGKWHLIKHNSGHYNWFGPTKAKVSLVWLLNYKSK